MHLVCFSHLRWNFVYQRPQHIISRFVRLYPTYYVEEPLITEEDDGYTLTLTVEGVMVVVPHLQREGDGFDTSARLEIILHKLFKARGIDNYLFWYYTPMALAFTTNFNPAVIVYDCMDELGAFKFAPPSIAIYEKELFEKADIVFTGGNTLYEAKKEMHSNIHSFPSSIDKDHFRVARYIVQQPSDQAYIPTPRLGFFGVIDERFDIDLIREAALLKPDWHFVIIGPVVKIDPVTLPRFGNIHYLGTKSYKDLPNYISGWDIALIPFAINESTRFISPTKTPEYLAAGRPVLSTPITDVVTPYGENGMVRIVSNSAELVEQATLELASTEKVKWLAKVDQYLADLSWDNTWQGMHKLLVAELHVKH